MTQQTNNTYQPANSPKQPTETELKTAANNYHDIGLNVIPTQIIWDCNKQRYGKKFLCNSWSQWQTCSQTKEEFFALNWTGANGLTVVLGPQTKTGLYLAVIDYDVKDASENVKKKGEEILAEFPKTRMEQTVNQGLHLLYWSKKPAKNIITQHGQTGIELLGCPHLCVMSPSYGYSILNGCDIAEVDDINQLYLYIMKKQGIIKEETLQTQQHNQYTQNVSRFNEPRQCIRAALNCPLTGSDGHAMRLGIAAEYKLYGFSDEQIIDLFKTQSDFNYETCKKQVASIDIRKPLKCETIKKLDYCLPKCPYNGKQKRGQHFAGKDENTIDTISDPGLVTKDYIFEQAYAEEAGNYYIVYDRKDQKIMVHEESCCLCSINGIDYAPIEKLAWLPVTEAKEYGLEEDLFREIIAFFKNHLDVSDENNYDVYACFVMASWLREDFKTVPYLFFLGPKASGKTRGLECLHSLCYRAFRSSSITPAVIYRMIEEYHLTFLLDETEILNQKDKGEIIALLNCGYKKGDTAARAQGSEHGDFKIKFFDTFGFKALAGTRELADTLLSRCIITSMSQAVRQVNIFLDEAKAQELRNKLLLYRCHKLGKAGINNLMEIFTHENKDFRNGRITEELFPLLYVAPTIEVKQKLLAFMKQITQSDIEAEQTSLEAKVLDAIIKCEPYTDGGKITTQTITKTFNEDLTEDEKKNSRVIGRLVVALGFAKCSVGNKNLAGFKYDKTKIERLQARYTPHILQKTLKTLATLTESENMEKQDTLGYFNTDFASVNASVLDENASVNSTVNEQNNDVFPLKMTDTSVASVFSVSPQRAPSSQQEMISVVYEQLGCVFCQRGIMEDDWVQDDFTWNKPAHKKCYDEKQSQLAIHDEREEVP